MKNYAHQDIAVKRFAKEEFFGLLFDCGTGKTRTAIQIAEDKDMPVLVIAPKNLCDQWEDAIKDNSKYLDNDIFIYNSVKIKTKKGAKALEEFLLK